MFQPEGIEGENMKNTSSFIGKSRKQESGSIVVLVAIGMLAIIGVAGLAIDSSHAFVNVTRVQNALDAAALSAGKSLHQNNKNTTLASSHGASTFAQHLEGEMSIGVNVSFQYSDTLNPFVSGGTDPNFVRAISNNHTISMFLARVIPGVGDDWTIGSTAVSGPIPLLGGQVCDIAPLMVCGDPSDTDASDGTIGGLPINTGEIQCLKYGGGTNTGNGNGNGNNNNGGGNESAPSICGEQAPDDPDGVGPGNYHLLSLGGNGANIVRDNLAGSYGGCASVSGSVLTQPGVATGPVRQGFNTRFGEYQGGMNESAYPPDLVTASPMTYSEYAAVYNAGGPFNADGQEERRIMAVPIANCAGIQNGRTEVDVFALGCYFLRQKIATGGQESYIVGELIDDCEVSGTPGNGNPALGGPYKIILFNDPGNPAA